MNTYSIGILQNVRFWNNFSVSEYTRAVGSVIDSHSALWFPEFFQGELSNLATVLRGMYQVVDHDFVRDDFSWIEEKHNE